jgi:hypothetical protein
MARPRISPLDAKMYFTGKPCKNGHIAQRYSCNNECIECRKQKNSSPKIKAQQKQWDIDNKDYKNELSRKRYQYNIEKERERSRRKWLLYSEKVKATNLNWAKNNPNKFKALVRLHNSLRRLVVKQQCPKWADTQKIKEIYINRPEGYHVDHIIPLRGKTVSGLHVENNLQYLTIMDNSKKHNKFIGA